MNELLNEEYFHLGTDKILKELWLYPQMDQLYNIILKPYGGLWTSHQNKYSLSDWISYKEDINNNDELEYMQSLKSCLIKFKKDSNFISIQTNNDYKNLKDSGFVKTLNKPIIINKWYYEEEIHEIIDYEKLCLYYDLLYVNEHAHKVLRNYSVRTMYALNPECIEYYRPIVTDFEDYKIIKIGNKTHINEPNKEYYNLYNNIKNLFSIINDSDYNSYINKLYNESKRIINDLNENKYNIKNYDSKIVDTIVRNIYREKYLEKKKILLKK